MSAIIPKAVRIYQSTGAGMEIEWADGHTSVYRFQFLRDACPCATCDDERAKEGREFGDSPGQKGALPLYREPARPQAVERVGRYALSFTWNDGHASGIYSWEFLRMLCPCDACRALRQSAGGLEPGGSGAIERT
jgi:DUF971 family protein